LSTINNLAKRLKSYLTKEQVAQVVRAYEFAEHAHDGQYRRSGDPYITHPLAVANILVDMHMDHQSLMAAILHDVIEDTPASKTQLVELFGQEVAELVDGVSKIAQIKFSSRAEQQAENLRKMMLAMTRDIRVILVKLADRLHNMRTLHVMPPEKRRRIATETLEIYAPIAQRLGMYNMRVEFEDLCFNAIYPMRASLIAKAVKAARGNRKEILNTLKQSLEVCLEQEGIQARVLGREKHLYSIYMKMKEQRKPFSEIMDVFGFRIIVDKVDTCYRVLGAVHNYFTPIPGRFKDYIAIPKANGYQSLHTTLKVHSGVPMEVQIRNEEMEAMANNGIAAHWLYKSHEEPGVPIHTRAQAWMGRLLEMQQKAGNSMEFIENVKVDLFPDEIYVFTPKGEIKELPVGASVVDFAYAVHTKVGNHCVTAQVDGQPVPLSATLESGQTVRIITSPQAAPNPAWLNFVVTARARSNIRHFLKHLRREEAVRLGETLLDRALADYNLDSGHLPIERVVSALARNGYSDFDGLLGDIGLGNRLAPLVVRDLLGEREAGVDENEVDKRKPLPIRGTEGLLVTYAKCCLPLPGDHIVGHLSAGRGIVVHRDNCKNLLAEMRNNPEKCLALYWDNEIKQEFSTALRIELVNKKGILATLATKLSEINSNIESLNMVEKDAGVTIINLTVTVQDRVHLARIIKRIRPLPNVVRISRIAA
jgi:guanosine-3',5'-bis(diphosphate) 3'-pyrophosphohydrolase